MELDGSSRNYLLFTYLYDTKMKEISHPGNFIGSNQYTAQVQIRKSFERKIPIIFLPINLNMCFGCSKETSH